MTRKECITRFLYRFVALRHEMSGKAKQLDLVDVALLVTFGNLHPLPTPARSLPTTIPNSADPEYRHYAASAERLERLGYTERVNWKSGIAPRYRLTESGLELYQLLIT